MKLKFKQQSYQTDAVKVVADCPGGNPTAESIFGIIKVLQASEHVQLQVRAAKKAA